MAWATTALVPTPSVARHQHRLAVAGGVEGEEAAEVAEAAEHLGTAGGGHHRLDQVDGPLAGVDVDPGRRVGGGDVGGRAAHAVGEPAAAVTAGRSVISTATATGTG